MKNIIVITGATATGKTKLSIQLAKQIDAEIISADSMMVYKYMDIGTAKPTMEERENTPHHLIDIVEPSYNFTAKDFVDYFDDVIKNIKNKNVIVSGGTWLYLQLALFGMSEAPAGNWEIRKKLYEKNNQELWEELQKYDKEYAKKIHPNDKRRIIRALEVYYMTGKPFSLYQKEHNFKNKRYNFIGFIIERDKQELMERIEKRVEDMFEKGLIKEVKNLINMGFEEAITAKQAIGYKEIIPYLKGEISLEEAKENIKKNTKDFAKRQIRTFRNKTDFQVVNLSKTAEKDFIDEIKKLL